MIGNGSEMQYGMIWGSMDMSRNQGGKQIQRGDDDQRRDARPTAAGKSGRRIPFFGQLGMSLAGCFLFWGPSVILKIELKFDDVLFHCRAPRCWSDGY